MRYVIKKGDTLSNIAARYNTTVGDILDRNPKIRNRDKIYTDDVIEIPMLGKFGKWLRRVFK